MEEDWGNGEGQKVEWKSPERKVTEANEMKRTKEKGVSYTEAGKKLQGGTEREVDLAARMGTGKTVSSAEKNKEQVVETEGRLSSIFRTKGT